jgi:nucleoside-diphosphate-sugar epimerase
MRMKKVLLTGATGFIGRHTFPFLKDEGYEVHAAHYPGESPVDVGEGVHWHECDLLRSDQLRALVEEVKATHLLHLAWYTVHGQFWTSIENLNWVRASVDLLMSFADAGGDRAVMAGTCAEYGFGNDYSLEGVTPTEPETLYGVCKNSMREILQGFSDQTGLSSAWGRLFMLYGPHEARGRLVPSVIISLLENKPALCTHGKQIRDYLYVEDAASAFVSLLDSEAEGPVNIASGDPVALGTVVESIAQILGKRDLVELGALPAREDEPPFIVADVHKLHAQVGWKPLYTRESGFKNAIEWWRENL